jgi:hypothetical protein
MKALSYAVANVLGGVVLVLLLVDRPLPAAGLRPAPVPAGPVGHFTRFAFCPLRSGNCPRSNQA